MSASPAARSAADSPSGSGRGPAGILGSLALHGALLAAFFVTWQHRLDIPDVTPPVVPVELVTISSKTNIRAPHRPVPKIHTEEPKPVTPPPTPAPPQPKAEPTPPVEKPEPPKPPEPKTEEPLPEKAEPLPKPPPPKPKEKPKPAPMAPTEQVKEKPQPKQKSAAAEPQKEKTKDFDIDNVESLLNKVAPAEKPAENAKPAERTVRGIGAQSAMTMELADALRNQIAQCWSPPVGSPDAKDLVVDFDLLLNQDGSVARPPQLLASSGSNNSYARAAAEAARRAIYECAPYKLPPDKYSTWREIKPFHFDPRQMMDQ